jgi:beta-mannanase
MSSKIRANRSQPTSLNKSKKSSAFKKGNKISKKSLLILALVFAAAGYYLLRNSFAATPVLLSQGKPIAASSTSESTYPANNANDGSMSTRWSSAYTDPSWIQIDLGSVYNISQVKLNWETAYGKAYQIQTSYDNINWSSIYSTNVGDGGLDDLTGLSGSGRFIRLYGTLRGTQWGYSLWEFQVYGTPLSSGSVTLLSNADTYVTKNTPTVTHGSEAGVYIDGGNSTFGDNINNAYLKFDLSTLAGKNISSAKLRLFVTNPTTQTQAVMGVTDNNWQESINWSNKPVVGSQVGSTPASNQSGTWEEVNLTSYAQSKTGGLLSLEIHNPSGIDGYEFSSRQGTNPPQLVVDIASPDSTPPTVSVTSPTSGSAVSGTAVNVAANAADNTGVAKVEFYVDSTLVNTDTSSPYAFSWNSTTVSNSTHTVQAKASDAAGNSATSSVNITVSNQAASNKIYWGAHIEGEETYNYYYPGQRPGGWCKPNVTEWCDAPWDGETWNKFESNAGKKASLLGIGQPPPWVQTTWDSGAMNLIYARGAIPFLSMGQNNKDNLSAVAAGNYDNQIRTWATNVKNWGKPIFLRPWWEMNGTWFSWGDTKTPATTYINAWRRFHQVATSAGATNLTWVWCPNINNTQAANDRYPGNDYVDWTCLDGYNKNPTTLSFSQVINYSGSYDNLVKLAPTKPIIIGETASLEYASGVKASWINDMMQTQLPNNFKQIKGFLWFNWRINECNNGVCGNQPFPIESSASAKQAFHDSLQSSYYAPGGSFTAPPNLTKVKPLQ